MSTFSLAQLDRVRQRTLGPLSLVFLGRAKRVGSGIMTVCLIGICWGKMYNLVGYNVVYKRGYRCLMACAPCRRRRGRHHSLQKCFLHLSQHHLAPHPSIARHRHHRLSPHTRPPWDPSHSPTVSTSGRPCQDTCPRCANTNHVSWRAMYQAEQPRKR